MKRKKKIRRKKTRRKTVRKKTVRKKTSRKKKTKRASYRLLNAEMWSKKHPSFEIPDEVARHALDKGDGAKLVFISGKNRERMWVKVTSAKGKTYTGKLENKPVFVPLKYGQTVKFSPKNIADIIQ